MRKWINLVNEEALELEKHGWGMEVWQNDQVALSGGMRSGSSPPGYTRLLYIITDMPEFQRTGDQTAAEVGKVEVWRSSRGIEGLVKIEVDKSKRRGGIGMAVIKSLVDTWHDHFVITDIVKSALPFWKAVGCRFFTRSGKEMTISEARAAKATIILGVIFKEGSTTPVTDLVSFYSTKPKIAEAIENRDRTFYHVTVAENLPSIMEKGLQPTIGDRSKKLGERACVFLFPTEDDAADAVSGWLGDQFDEEDEITLALLEVTIPPEIEVHQTDGVDCYTTQTIPPEGIRIISRDF